MVGVSKGPIGNKGYEVLGEDERLHDSFLFWHVCENVPHSTDYGAQSCRTWLLIINVECMLDWKTAAFITPFLVCPLAGASVAEVTVNNRCDDKKQRSQHEME